jgi:hypothetical protein
VDSIFGIEIGVKSGIGRERVLDVKKGLDEVNRGGCDRGIGQISPAVIKQYNQKISKEPV